MVGVMTQVLAVAQEKTWRAVRPKPEGQTLVSEVVSISMINTRAVAADVNSGDDLCHETLQRKLMHEIHTVDMYVVGFPV